jgi:hypothetical protein
MGDEIPQASCNRNFTTSFINDARNAWWNVKYPTLDDKYKNTTGKTADEKKQIKTELDSIKDTWANEFIKKYNIPEYTNCDEEILRGKIAPAFVQFGGKSRRRKSKRSKKSLRKRSRRAR